MPWDFSTETDPAIANGADVLKNDPCKVHWQGVQCDCRPFPTDAHADGFYYDDDSHKTAKDLGGRCSVSKLQLIGLGLKGERSVDDDCCSLTSADLPPIPI